MDVRPINPEEFTDRIIFIYRSNVQIEFTDWTKKGHSVECFSNSEKSKGLRKNVPRGHWSFFGPGEENTRHGTHTYKPEGQWKLTADVMVDNFKESGHPIFRASSALDRGLLRKMYDSLHCGISKH